MKVLITAVSRFEKPSGICRSAANLANSLIIHPAITQVYVAVGSWQVDYFQENFHLDPDRIEIVPIAIKNSSLARNWWYMMELPALAKTLDCPLVHLSFPVPVLSSLFSARIVLTLNDLYPFEIPENFGYPQVYLNQLFTSICLANCDGLTCISSYTLQQLRKYFPKNNKPVEVVYITVDFDDKQPQQPAQLSPDLPFILSVAQHRKNKNLDVLIKAFHKLRQTGQTPANTTLVIVGSHGSETEYLHQLVNELGISHNVLFLSSLVDPELMWLYQHCRLMVLPSSVEGLGLPVIESLHFSCRVICSDIPTLREIGGTQCTFFSLDGDAVDNLTQALHQVWTSPNRPSVKDLRFDKKTISDQYVAFYEKLSATQAEIAFAEPSPIS